MINWDDARFFLALARRGSSSTSMPRRWAMSCT